MNSLFSNGSILSPLGFNLFFLFLSLFTCALPANALVYGPPIVDRHRRLASTFGRREFRIEHDFVPNVDLTQTNGEPINLPGALHERAPPPNPLSIFYPWGWWPIVTTTTPRPTTSTTRKTTTTSTTNGAKTVTSTSTSTLHNPTTTTSTSSEAAAPFPEQTSEGSDLSGQTYGNATITHLHNSSPTSVRSNSRPTDGDPFTSTTSLGNPDGELSNSQRDNKGLIIGVIFGVLFFLALIAAVAFLCIRRRRRKQWEKEQITSTNSATWIQSRSPTMRARTPGGSSAIPVPYNPSEVSEDQSAHFRHFTPDPAVGVPVPYPLAIHVPPRVAQALAERETLWNKEDLAKSYNPDDLPTSALTRSNTMRTDESSAVPSSDVHVGVYYTPSPRLSNFVASNSTVGSPGYTPAADPFAARSNVTQNRPVLPHELDNRPLPPLPALRRSSTANPFDSDISVSDGRHERVAGSSNTQLNRRPSLESEETDGSTVQGHGAVRNVVSVGRVVRNPFADVPDDEPGPLRTATTSRTNAPPTRQFSIRSESSDYAGVVEHQPTEDGHLQQNLRFAFPAPPVRKI